MRLSKFLSRVLDNSNVREISHGAATALLIRLAGTAIGFLVSITVARMLGASDAGVYFLSVSIVTIVATCGRA